MCATRHSHSNINKSFVNYSLHLDSIAATLEIEIVLKSKVGFANTDVCTIDCPCNGR
jgi:hypothetical protein